MARSGLDPAKSRQDLVKNGIDLVGSTKYRWKFSGLVGSGYTNFGGWKTDTRLGKLGFWRNKPIADRWRNRFGQRRVGRVNRVSGQPYSNPFSTNLLCCVHWAYIPLHLRFGLQNMSLHTIGCGEQSAAWNN